MVTGPDGRLPLPWLERPLAQAVAQQRGQTLLIHGSPDIGALELAVAIAQGQLCEAPAQPGRPCGQCASCRLVQARAHPDLLLLMPEAQRHAHRWPIAVDKPESESDDGKARKRASRQIRIDEVRLALDWVSTTASRGRTKLLLLHPADALNQHAASALLKTLEEPPAAVRIVLTCSDPALLLPTIRSRCRQWTMPAPSAEEAAVWLQASGVGEPAVLLAAAGGAPLRARALFESGINAETWRALPKALARGDGSLMAGWPVEQILDAMQRLCHDLMRRAAGGEGLYFERSSLPAAAPALQACIDWQRELVRVARHADHPWQEPLLLDSLVLCARRTMQFDASSVRARRPLDTLSS